MSDSVVELRPQPGPQTAFLASGADIAIYGGAAGGGKSWALLVEPLRHVHIRRFRAVIFRRMSTEFTKSGGLWDEANEIYPRLGANVHQQLMRFRFPSGGNISFGHIEHEKTLEAWHSAQIAMIGYDELTTFTERMFWYMLSRNRSLCGVRPYIRATCNPNADSWVAKLVEWWIDPETGYPLPERAGRLRWFIRVDGQLEWGDDPAELHARFDETLGARNVLPKSFTFIPATLADNKILDLRNPEYRAGLMAMPLVERERFLAGNWKIRPTAGNVFRRDWFGELVADCPHVGGELVRAWDKAGSATDGDWSAGVLMLRYEGTYYVVDVIRGRWRPKERNDVIYQTAQADVGAWGRRVRLVIEQEPGNGGAESAAVSAVELAEFGPEFVRPATEGSKEVRARPLSAQAEARNVRVLNRPWAAAFLEELENFPSPGWHDDQVDGAAYAFNKLAQQPARRGALPIGRRYGR